ncbi:MAG: hypothetical protein ACRDDX_07305 [Cellulosilyticaceae bacterium]
MGTNKKMGIIIGIIMGVMLLVIGVPLFAGDAIMVQFMPQAYLTKAFAKTGEKIAKESELKNKALQMVDFNAEKALESAYTIGLKKVNGMPISEVATGLDKMALTIEGKNNETQSLLGIGLQDGSEKVVALEIYQDEKEVGISLPPLMNEFLMAKTENFSENFNASELSRILEVTIPDMNLENTWNIQEVMKSEDFEKNIVQMSKDLVEGVKVSYLGSAEVEGQKCKLVSFNVEEKAIKSFLNTYYQFILEDCGYEAYQKQVMQLQYAGYYTDEEINQMWNEVKAEIKTVFDTMTFEDGITCEYAINSKEQIVKMLVTTDVGYEGEVLTVEADLSFKGEKYITDDIQFTMSFSDGTDTFECKVEATSNMAEKTPEKNQEIVVSFGEKGSADMLEITFKHTQNEDDQTIKGKLSLGFADEEELKLTYKGKLSYDAKQKLLEIDLSTVEGSFKDYYGEYSAELYVKGKLQSVEQADLKPQNSKDLLAMTENDLMGIVMNMMLKAQDLMSRYESYMY